MTLEDGDLKIVDVGPEGRDALEPLLEESFEGWYLRHAMKTLKEDGMVRKAILNGRPAGLVMLRTFYGTVGYVFYIAVARAYRRRKVGSTLLDDSLAYFGGLGVKEVYASVEGDNLESAGLFNSRGFVPTSYAEVSRRHGHLRALNMYRKMLVVPGEKLLCRQEAAADNSTLEDFEKSMS